MSPSPSLDSTARDRSNGPQTVQSRSSCNSPRGPDSRTVFDPLENSSLAVSTRGRPSKNRWQRRDPESDLTRDGTLHLREGRQTVGGREQERWVKWRVGRCVGVRCGVSVARRIPRDSPVFRTERYQRRPDSRSVGIGCRRVTRVVPSTTGVEVATGNPTVCRDRWRTAVVSPGSRRATVAPCAVRFFLARPRMGRYVAESTARVRSARSVRSDGSLCR